MPEALIKPPTLREKYQEFMRNFNPMTPADKANRVDLRPGLAARIASRAILDPGCQQAIVGGIGSGKTSELSAAFQALDESCFWFDVAEHTDLHSIQAGAILAIVGVLLGGKMRSQDDRNGPTARALREAHRYAKGYVDWCYASDWGDDPDHDYDPDHDSPPTRVSAPGKLKPPRPEVTADILAFKPHLQALIEQYQTEHGQLTIGIDGLDRLRDVETFWNLDDQVLQILAELKVSTIITVPLLTYFDATRELEQRFARVHPLWSLPVASDGLIEMLRKRDNDLLNEDALLGIAANSGGVLRDAISLARDAAEEAFLAGSPKIEIGHVEEVASRLGQSYRRGLGADQLKLLAKVAKGGSFSFQFPLDRELLATRRIIEYSADTFDIHPALRRELSSAN